MTANERVAQACTALRSGSIVAVADDADRENEVDLIMAASYATPERIAYFLENTSGYLCVAVTEERAATLDLHPMRSHSADRYGTAFLVTVDLHAGTTTGISARDRAATIRSLADPTTAATDLDRPGHVVPLLARGGGVLERRGHTEASVDLCHLAGLQPTALLCEVVTEDRLDMLHGAAVSQFARAHDLPLLSIQDIIDARHAHNQSVELTGTADIPSDFGTFRTAAFRSPETGIEHIALWMGTLDDGPPVPTRLHSECLTGDLFGSLRCDCGIQLYSALDTIAEQGRGILIYHRGHEGRGIGIGAKLRAYDLQQHHALDTVDANTALGLPVDHREYSMAAGILQHLRVNAVDLMTNNPEKVNQLRKFGVDVRTRIPLQTRPTSSNLQYLTTKRDRMGHMLDLPTLLAEGA